MQKRATRVFTLLVILLALAALASVGVFAAASRDSSSVTNPFSPAINHPYRHGVEPTIAQMAKIRAYVQSHATSANTLSYGGGIDGIGVTSGVEKVYLVFYGTQWGTQSTDSHGNLAFSNDTAGAAPYLQNLFKSIGTGNELWSGTMTQYCDGPNVSSGATSCASNAAHVGYPTGGALAGVWYDNSGAEPDPASGHQLAVEAVNAAAHFGNTTAASNRYAQYDILSATGTNPDNYQTGGFCAWHDYNGDSTLDGGGGAPSPYGDIAFTNMPYVLDAGSNCGENYVNSGSNGALDGFSIVNGHEYAETVTDQNPAGGWTNTSNGQENGDECAWINSGQGASANVTMGNGSYAMQSTWSNDTNECDISHPIVSGGGGSNDFSISASPTSLTISQGSNGTSTISTAVTSGSAGTVSLTASVSPSGPTASLSPTSVTAGGPSTLTVTVGSSVATGSYTVTVTGSEGSAQHSTTVSVTVTSSSGGSNDFSISASPGSLTITQGSNGTTQISTAVTSGSAGTVSLTASVSPSGPTTSLSATSVTAGSSSTLTVTVGSSVTAGSYTVTVAGTEGSAQHSATVSVTVTASGGGGSVIANGSFETGTFSNWTTGGTTSISTTAHSGKYSGQAGANTPTRGNSSIKQTFTAASGTSTLTFWYQVHCLDTVQYDWATATLKDNTTGTTKTILARTCSNNNTWVKVTASVTAGHSYTLTLTSHDDNYPGDPTYTLFDDVAVN